MRLSAVLLAVVLTVLASPAAHADETPTGTSTETSTETPAGTPTETTAGTTAGTPAEGPTGTPAEGPTESPAEAPAEQPADAPVETPAQAPAAAADQVSSLPSAVRGAHRTAALEGPEGSAAGIEAAIAAGSDVVDLDLRVLADGEVVVSHDPSTTRLTVHRRGVAKLTLPDWLGLGFDVTSWFGPVAPIAPLTFRQVLADYADRVVLLAELKTPATLPGAIALVHEAGAEGSVILQSNDPAVVRQVRDAGLHAGLWRSPGQVAADDPATWLASGAEQLVVLGASSPELVSKAVSSGLPVWVCGINLPSRVPALLGLGVSGILSDAPAFTFGRSTQRRVLPMVQFASSLTLRRGRTGYVSGRVILPALGTPVPGAAVAVSVTGAAYRTRTAPNGTFRVRVKAPTTTGTYRPVVTSTGLTVSVPGSELEGWRVQGTSRTDGVRPVLRVVR